MALGTFGLVAATFGAGILSSITGGTSLLTVPLLMMSGLDAQQAIATNMVVVAILSAGASITFLAAKQLRLMPTLLLAATAIPGSLVGAMLTVALDETWLRLIISIALIGIAALSFVDSRTGSRVRHVGRQTRLAGYVLLALWALYGGLFSGGYATVLTLGIVYFFGHTLEDAVGMTRVINLVGSLAASAIFAARGQVHWNLVLSMGLAAALGGVFGARLALRARPDQLRRLFALVLAGIGLRIGYGSLDADGRRTR